jgi:hypothetical protein
MGHSLIIRRRADGRTTIDSDIPDEHGFSARWIARNLGELVSVQITLHTDDGDVEYQLVGYGDPGQGSGDPSEDAGIYTHLRAERIT